MLVSFCNVYPRGLALGLHDFDNDSFRWLDLAQLGDDIRGVTGLVWHDDRYWCLAQMFRAGSAALVAFDDRFKIQHVFELELVHDGHSLMSFEGGLLITDTGGNRLVWVDTAQAEQTIREVEYWRYCDEATDVVHLNSVAQLAGKLYVSIFGPRPGEGWSFGTEGKIINITDGVVVSDHQIQPHSLVADDDALLWLESATGAVHRFTTSGGPEVLTRLDGFVRGLALQDGNLFVGSSMARRRSRSMGTSNKPPSKPPELHTWIYRIDRTTLKVDARKLSAIAAEIYDLHPVPGAPMLDDNLTVDPVVQRIWQCEDQEVRSGDRLRLMIWQKIEAMQVVSAALADTGDEIEALSAARSEFSADLEPIQRRLRELTDYVESAAAFSAAKD